jgi:hypothetical protein
MELGSGVDMNYVLEDIAVDDQEKIIRDFEIDSYKKALLLGARKRNDLPRTWAIDRERNNYLFLAPLASYEESINRPYFAYLDGHLYQFNSIGSPSNRAYFVGAVPEGHLQEEIKTAFSVYGRWGKGPKPDGKEPQLSFLPDMKEER